MPCLDTCTRQICTINVYDNATLRDITYINERVPPGIMYLNIFKTEQNVLFILCVFVFNYNIRIVHLVAVHSNDLTWRVIHC